MVTAWVRLAGRRGAGGRCSAWARRRASAPQRCHGWSARAQTGR